MMTEYTVRAGDSLSKIARDVLGDMALWPELAARNGIQAPYRIEVGQVLRLTDDPPEQPVRHIQKGTTIIAPVPQDAPPRAGRSKWAKIMLWTGLLAGVSYFMFPPKKTGGMRRRRRVRRYA